MRRARLALAALLLSPAALVAQSAPEVRGTVTDSASGRGVAGAVTMLLDARDSVLARSLTNERGEYRLARPDAARRLQLRRIGFRPRTLALPPAGAALDARLDARLDVRLARIPTMLERVQVTDAARCPRRPDRDRALGLWEQARAALLAAVVARETEPDGLVRLRYDRVLEGDGRVVSQRVRVDSTERSSVPFGAARSGADFVRDGFLADSAGAAIFFGPDADVLLDESFARGYCFHVVRGEGPRPSQVGLAFEAPNRRRGRVDIAGVLWVDTLARAIRDVEFRYVGLDRPVAGARPGGRVSFREMSNGVVMIDRWSLRIAALGADTTYGRTGNPEVRTWFDPREVGGEVARLRWPDGADWAGALGTLRLDLVRKNGSPAEWAVVRLDDTDYHAQADVRGALTIRDLLPGPYAPAVEDTTLERVGAAIPLPARFVAVRDSVTRLRVEVPDAADHVGEMCRAAGSPVRRAVGADARDSAAWVLGRVMSADGRSVRGTNWSVSRQVRGEWVRVARSYTGSDGFFAWCGGLPLGEPARVSVWRDGGVPIDVDLVLRQKVTAVPLPLPTGGTAAR